MFISRELRIGASRRQKEEILPIPALNLNLIVSYLHCPIELFDSPFFASLSLRLALLRRASAPSRWLLVAAFLLQPTRLTADLYSSLGRQRRAWRPICWFSK